MSQKIVDQYLIGPLACQLAAYKFSTFNTPPYQRLLCVSVLEKGMLKSLYQGFWFSPVKLLNYSCWKSLFLSYNIDSELLHIISDYTQIFSSHLFSGKRLYHYNEDFFLVEFLLLTSFFRIKSLQVIKEKLF